MVETHNLLVFPGNQTIPGLLRWCEVDFATIHRISVGLRVEFLPPASPPAAPTVAATSEVPKNVE